MKKISLLIVLVLTIALSSCSININQTTEHSQDVLSNATTDTTADSTSDFTEDSTADTTIDITSDVAAETTSESDSPTYSYDNAAKIHDVFQKGASFLTAEMDFCKSMWEISKYGDEKEVHDSFLYYISKQNADKTISDTLSALSEAVNRELENCDPTLAPLLETVLEKYSELTGFFTNPSGAYKEYIKNYESCFEEYVFAFDEMTSYLYDVGYYTE